MINKALDLPFPEPEETYSTSDYLYDELEIPKTATGRLPRAQRTRAGLGAEEIEDLGETGRRRPPQRDKAAEGRPPRSAKPRSGDARRQDSPRSAPDKPAVATGGGAPKARNRRRRRLSGSSEPDPSGSTDSG
jgi:hypothetical protein